MPRPMPLVEPVTRAVLPVSMELSPYSVGTIWRMRRVPVRGRAEVSDICPMVTPKLNYVPCADADGGHRMAYWSWGDDEAARVVICVHGLSRQGRDFDVLS